ncbi:hypothetical protein D3C72_2138860 [compost metagenome]
MERRAPCRKNSNAMATLLATIMNDAPLPTAGKKLAKTTVAIRMSVNWSGRKRRMAEGFPESCGNYRRAPCHREGH